MKTTITAILCALALAVPTNALAQEDTTERARRILAESQAHHEAGREALAAEGYLQLYEALREIGRAGAPVALWNAGNALAEVPGRERDAIATLRRFLDESTILTDDPQIRTWRSTAIGLIAELEARAPQSSGQELGEPDGSPAEEPTPSATPEGSSISPVGPILLGAGGTILLAGVISGGISLGQGGDFSSACDDLSACSPTLRPQYDEMRTLSAVADVLLVAGGVTTALGIILTLTLTEGSDEAAATASCGADGCRATVWGRF